MQHSQQTAVRIGVIVAAIAALAAVASGGAAAADPADVEIYKTENATDVGDSGPLPDKRVTYGIVTVTNTSDMGSLSASEVSFDAGGVTVTKVDPLPSRIEGKINPGDIPEGGLTVDVNVDGTTIGSTTLYAKSYDTDTVTVNKSLIENANNITVTVDGSEVEASDYQTSEPYEGNSSLNIYTGEPAPETLGVALVDLDSNTTFTETTTPSDIGQSYWDAAVKVDIYPTTLYFSDAITEIKIDGETVYDPAPLGGGGGDGGGSSGILLLLIVVAGGAVYVLSDD